MDIPLNVEVHCPDGRCGRSTYIIINPTTEQVTERVSERERRCDVPVVHLAPAQFLAQRTLEDSDGQPVNVVDCHRKEEQRADHPAEIASGRTGGDGIVRAAHCVGILGVGWREVNIALCKLG